MLFRAKTEAAVSVSLFTVAFVLSASQIHAQTCTLPCIPCQNGGRCLGGLPYVAPDGQTFGTCNCSNTGFTGAQCERALNAACSTPCQHNGTCVGGLCVCPIEYSGIDCSTPMCAHQQGAPGPLPVTPNGTCPQPCADGFGGPFCWYGRDARACAATGRQLHTQLVSVDNRLRWECNSEDPAWTALLDGKSVIGIGCHNPSGWSNGSTDGKCQFTFLRTSKRGSQRTEELFTCAFSQCSAGFSRRDTVDSAKALTAGTSVQVVEPSSTKALRWLLFVFTVGLGLLSLPTAFPRKGVAVVVAILLVTLFQVLNLAVSSTTYEDENKAATAASRALGESELAYSVTCQRSECKCNENAQDEPRCASFPQFRGLVEGLTTGVTLACSNATQDCTFRHSNLFGGSFPIAMNCQGRDCVQAGRAAAPIAEVISMIAVASPTNAGSIAVGVLGALGGLALVVSVFVHIASMRRSRARWCTAFEGVGSGPVDEENMVLGDGEAGAGGASPTGSVGVGLRGVSYSVSRLASSGSETVGDKQILKNVSMHFEGGTMTAIIGPSGCGKTTVLDILAGRLKTGTVTGDGVFVSFQYGGDKSHVCVSRANGASAATSNRYRRMVGYVADDDVLLPTLTVIEALRYSAAMRQPIHISMERKEELIRGIISAFKLEGCMNTIIGTGNAAAGSDVEGGLSQGERRRVTIAAHLVAMPRILVLDEPTTGLDSYNARLVIDALHRACKQVPAVAAPAASPLTAGAMVYTSQYYPGFYNYRPTVVMSIHQPSMDLFNRCDRVVLMANGEVLHDGSTNHAELQAYLRAAAQSPAVLPLPSKVADKPPQGDGGADAAATPPCAPVEVPVPAAAASSSFESMSLADQLVQVASEMTPSGNGEADRVSPAVSPTVAATAADIGRLILLQHNAAATGASGNHVADSSQAMNDPFVAVAHAADYMPPFWSQVGVLMQRGWLTLLRRKQVLALHYLIQAIVALLLAIVYEGSSRDVRGTLSKAGGVTFVLLWTSVVNLSALEMLVSERGTFVFEKNSACYSVGAYWLTKMLLDVVLLRVLPAGIMATLLYFPASMKPIGEAYLTFVGILVLFSVCTALLSMMFGALIPQFGPSLLCNVFAIMIFFAFGGLVSQSNFIPPGLRWIRWVSPFMLAFEPMMVRELIGELCTFTPVDPAGEPTTGVSLTLDCIQYVFNLGLRPDYVNLDVALLAAWAAVWGLIAFLTLAFLVRGRR